MVHVLHTKQNLLFSRCCWSFHVLLSVVSVAVAVAVALAFALRRRSVLKLSSEGREGPKERGHCEEMAVGGVATVVDKVNLAIALSS